MKRINIIKYAVVVAIPLLISSCMKLDQFPYDSIARSQSFEKAGDAAKWDLGIYSLLRGRVYGIYTYTTDVQADQLNATIDYGNRNGAPYRWTDFLAGDYSISGIWSGYYSAIANLNIILNNVDNIKTNDATEDSVVAKTKADAYLARAFYYQKLILHWAKAYEPSTASDDPGVPIVLTFDVNAMPARATVQDVYDRILKDLDSAQAIMTNIGVYDGYPGADEFNQDVVLAQRARTMLNMQNWEAAYTAANTLIQSGTYPLITTAAVLENMWKYDYPQEVIFQSYVSTVDGGEFSGANNIYLKFDPGDPDNGITPFYDPDFVPAQWVVDAYANQDIRKNVYFKDTAVRIGGIDYSDIYLVNKFPGNPYLFTTATSNYEQAPKIFRIAEMYLIAAEAAANQSGHDDEARDAINDLRVARGLTALPNSISGSQLMDSIKMGRYRELAFEGFRLNDLKRWHEGFTRHDPQNTAFLIGSGDGGMNTYAKTVQADADKFVWGIPTRDITVNPNLKGHQNPGW